MKLIQKIILPILILFSVSIVLFIGMFYTLQSRVLLNNTENTINKQIEVLQAKMEQYDQDVTDLKEQLNEDYLIKARTVAFIISEKPNMIESKAQLLQLCKDLDVEEIHLCDDQGY